MRIGRFYFFSETHPSSFDLEVFAVSNSHPSVLQKICELHYNRSTNNESMLHFDIQFPTDLIVFRGRYVSMAIELFGERLPMPIDVFVRLPPQQQQVTVVVDIDCLCVINWIVHLFLFHHFSRTTIEVMRIPFCRRRRSLYRRFRQRRICSCSSRRPFRVRCRRQSAQKSRCIRYLLQMLSKRMRADRLDRLVRCFN